MILSLGACVFTQYGLVPGADFHAFLDLGTQLHAGMTMDPETVLWWLSQSDAARSPQCESLRQPVAKVLLDFKDWWRGNEVETVWGNGADFDIPILAALFNAAGIPVPWRYNQGRCMRTIFQLAGVKPGHFGTVNALAHDGLEDARFQAAETAAAMRHLAGFNSIVLPVAVMSNAGADNAG